MNKDIHTTIGGVEAARRCGDSIVLEHTSDRCWRVYKRSAFLVWMPLPKNACTSFLDAAGNAVTELSAHNISLLSDRLEQATEQTPDRMIFVAPVDVNLPIFRSAFDSWKRKLSLNPHNHELPSPVHR